MATLQIGTSSSLADKVLRSTIFANQLTHENPLEQSGMIGVGENYVVQILNDDLDQGGDQITYHRANKFTGAGFDEGDPKEGYEQAGTFDDDSVKVSSKEFAFRLPTVMDDQRTLLDLMAIHMKKLREQIVEWKSWMVMTYLSGKVGTNVEILGTDFTGWAGNALTDVDATHLMYGGNATAKNDLDSSDTMVYTDFVRLKDKARTLTYKIPALTIKGKKLHVVAMHPNVWRDLKTSAATQNIYDIEKAQLQGGQDAMANALITASVGVYNGCIILLCDQCAIYTDYGVGSNVRASRVLFLGPQAAVWAMGRKTQKTEWVFEKETFEYKSEVGVLARTIGGCKAVIFASQRSAMLAMDVATLAA